MLFVLCLPQGCGVLSLARCYFLFTRVHGPTHVGDLMMLFGSVRGGVIDWDK